MNSKIMNDKKEKRKYNVPAVGSAVKILTLLSRKKFRSSNLTEISNALNLTPTTCYRILQQLEELSIVRCDKGSKRYSLGPYLVVLGERAKENIFDISVIIPYLESISEETGLTSVLASRIGKTRSTFIAKAEGGNFGINVSVGRHFSVVDGAYGKCLLAFMDESESEELLNSEKGLRLLSPSEIEDLKNEFFLIRKKGYAISYGEYINGIFGVAAPIFNCDRKTDMVVSLIGMTAQYKAKDLKSKGELLKNLAIEISTKIGAFSNKW